MKDENKRHSLPVRIVRFCLLTSPGLPSLDHSETYMRTCLPYVFIWGLGSYVYKLKTKCTIKICLSIKMKVFPKMSRQNRQKIPKVDHHETFPGKVQNWFFNTDTHTNIYIC